MDGGVDLSTITRAERWVFGFGVAQFLNAMVPWWFRIRTTRQTFYHNAGLGGLGLIAALAGFVAAGIVMTRHVRTPAAFSDGVWYPGAGVVAVVALVIQAFTGRSLWIGFWFALALAAAMLGAAVVRLKERRRGWI